MIFSWKIAVGNFKGDLEYITPESMRECFQNGDGTTVWRGHDEYGADFCVRANIVPYGERVKGHLEIEGFNGRKFIEQVRFPVLTVPYTDEAQLMNGAMDLGLLINDPWLLQDQVENEFDCASTSLFALLYPAGNGIYLDCREGDYSPKKAILRPMRAEGKAELSMVFFPGNGKEPFTEWNMAGYCVFGEFKGSWFEAAQIYKEYAVTRREFMARKYENPLRNIGLWLWNRGNVADVVPPLLELQKELPGIPLALDWYWWHHNPYDTNYPNFWPPREGEETFRNAVSELRARGIFVQVYLNGVCWDMDDDSFADGADEAVLNRDGSIRSNVFNRYTKHRLAWMCASSERFQKRLALQIRKLHECGLSGQYLDMIGAFGNVPCYSLEHGHLRGGSGANVEGYRKFLGQLKEEFPGYPFSSEGCNEAFMDLLDASIVCNTASVEHFGGSNEVIPVFPAIYHGRNAMALFGNYALPAGIPPWDPLWPPEDRWKEEKPWQSLCWTCIRNMRSRIRPKWPSTSTATCSVRPTRSGKST